eukprot:g517.t1
MGSGIFAGNVYRCYTTRFAGEPLVDCNATPASKLSVGCAGTRGWDPFQAACDPDVLACPKGKGLTVSKCQGCAGEGSELVKLKARVYLYRGREDACYNPPSVNHTADFFKGLGATVHFEASIPSLHSIPTVSDGTPCGTEGDYSQAKPHGLEACGYDGAGACLQHIYGALAPAVAQQSENVFSFLQAPFNFGPDSPTPWVYGAGLDELGYVYAPKRCQKRATTALSSEAKAQPCKLHIFAHGCGMHYKARGAAGEFGLTYVRRAGFNEWAEANGIVILYPQKYIDCNTSLGRPCTGSMGDGCWDQDGGTSTNFTDKAGVQEQAITYIERFCKDLFNIISEDQKAAPIPWDTNIKLSQADIPEAEEAREKLCLAGEIELVGCGTAVQVADIHTKGLERTKFQAFRDVMCGYRTYNDLISGDPETVSTVRRIAQRKLEEELEYVVTDSVYSYRL